MTGSVAALAATGAWRSLTPRSVRDLAVGAGTWGPLVYMALFSLASFTFFPRGIISLGGGIAFGLPSAAYTYFGAMVGENLAFLLARLLGRGFVEARLGPRLRRWDEALGRHGFRWVFAMRLVPVVPCDVINYVAGLGRVPYPQFLLATALGIVPNCLAFAVAGDGLVTGDPATLAVGAAALAVLVVVPVLILWRRKGH
ncbi:MAG: TVP38/TMEM64 family protein [Planctomycetales bacterium]|nr:TVP38/TMEM64 family protein [Planctomycetales bacterium]